jgi:hypothetical protein
MENQMQYVQHDLLLHSEVKPTPELMNDAQKLQAQLERDDISWDEMLLLRRDDPNDLRYANYEDLCENTHCKTFVFFGDNSALDVADGVAVKFTQVINGDIIETTYLD